MSGPSLLIDANLSLRLAVALREHGVDACHVVELGLGAADDGTILQHAADDERILVSFDLDFANLKAAADPATAGVMLLRLVSARVKVVLPRILAALAAEGEALAGGAVVTVEPARLRVRRS